MNISSYKCVNSSKQYLEDNNDLIILSKNVLK